MNCLWCDEEVIPELSWKNIVLLSEPKSLCEPCEKQLKKLQGERCIKCSRQSTESICLDCQFWEEDDPLEFNRSVYSYNPHIRAMIAQWKYRGDYILAHLFKPLFIRTFIEEYSFLMKEALLIPIPLSDERIEERGFNQAKVLADFLPLPNQDLLTRIHQEKQAKKTRFERISANNPFIMNERIDQKVILIDDMYTTGTTLRQASVVLREKGCPEIYSFTLIRS